MKGARDRFGREEEISKRTRLTRLIFTVSGGFALLGLWLFVMAPPMHNDAVTVGNALACDDADLGVAKTVNNAAPNVGDVITYTIVVTNSGPSDATGVQLTDKLPTGVTFGGYTATQGFYTNSLWTVVGGIDSGAGATLTITATVDSGTCITTIINLANELTADQSDPESGNNEASVTITVTGADLAVTKTVNNTTPNAGDAITYTITVTNNGPDDATGAQLTDVLPAGVTFGGYIATEGAYISATGLWTVSDIGCGANATLAITATVDSCTGVGTITNTAILTAASPDPNPTNNEASAGINSTSVHCLYLPIICENCCYPFVDTFASSSSGWPEVDNAKLETKYTTGGEYLMRPKNANLHYVYNLHYANYFTDYEIEVDARWAISTSTGKGYGIIFGLASDDSHAYLYQVNSDRREYRLLLRYASRPWDPLTNNGTNYGWVYTDTIYSSLTPDPNRLKVIRSGSQISLYVNSVHLETLMNSAITSGRVGLSVQSYGAGNAGVLFDNYILNYCIEPASSIHAESNPPVSIRITGTGALPGPD